MDVAERQVEARVVGDAPEAAEGVVDELLELLILKLLLRLDELGLVPYRRVREQRRAGG